jgi:xylulokinase
MSLLAIDMGSSSCKAIVYALDGSILGEATHYYTPVVPAPSCAELPSEVFWQAFRQVTRTLATKVTTDPIEALGISSHGETFVPVDAHHQPLSSAILNMDNRAVAQAGWLTRVLDPKRIFEITGLVVHPMYPVPKILWLREHQTDLFRKSQQFLPVPTYLLARLGLPLFVDYSLASRFLAFDVRRKMWSTEILDACRLEPDRFPTPVPAGTVVGQLSDKVATDLGLGRGTPAILGGHDQPCAALGMGVTEAGRISASLGTYECLLAASREPLIEEAAYVANLNTYCHVVPDRYVTLAYFPSGIMLDWFLRLVRNGTDEGPDIDRICSVWEDQAGAGPSGLLIAPHLLGTCNPDFNPNASGVIAGLRPATSAAEIYKGILEGVACEFAAMAGLLRNVTGPFRDVYVTGGGCRSKLGLQLRAALSGCRLHRTTSSDAVCLGTAILAGAGAGKYRDVPGTIAELVKVAETVAPDPLLCSEYRACLQQYRLLYSGLANLRGASSAIHSQGDS